MKNKIILGVLVSNVVFFGCKTSQKNQNTNEPANTIIGTIGTKPVLLSEFKYVYDKNNHQNEGAYTEKGINDYLNLYTNFRLKVADSESLGLDTSQSFKTELAGYRKQLAAPYLKEKDVTEKLVSEAYSRLKEEINASHILIELEEDAEPKDTLVAYKELIEIRNKALKGTSFDSLAYKFSKDPSAKTNYGNLGYFTALQMVYPFEQAAYTTPVGQISYPVRTKFGYHIVKVNKKRASQGQVKVAHIMVRCNEGSSAEDTLDAKNKIDEIYSKLNSGSSWDILCSQFSDDTRTKSTNGELNWFGTNQMLPNFEDASFGLKNKGDISKPIRTPYGYHIIKLIEKKPVESFTELEAGLKVKVGKDSRSELNKSALLTRLKKDNKLIENTKSLKIALDKADSSLVLGKWKAPIDESVKNELFSINKESYSLKSFYTYIENNQSNKINHTAQFLMQMYYKEYVNSSVLQYEESHLENKYPDYKMLVKEYRDGILLFQMMDDKVWSKAVKDTAGLKSFFASNTSKYMWKDRCEAVVYSAINEEMYQKAKTYSESSKFALNEKPESFSFKKDSIRIPLEGHAKLDNIISILKKDKTATVEIQVIRSMNENIKVNALRINALKNYFKNAGTDTLRTSIHDLGVMASQNEGSIAYKVFTKSFKIIEKINNESNPLNLQIVEGKFQKTENEYVDEVEWKPGVYTINKNNRKIIVVVKNSIPSSPKLLEETKGVVISDYQNYLEKTWLDSLKTKYPVVYNQEEIKKLVKK